MRAKGANALVRRGFSKSSLPVGTFILVDGFQAKDGSNTANGFNALFFNTIGANNTVSPRATMARHASFPDPKNGKGIA